MIYRLFANILGLPLPRLETIPSPRSLESLPSTHPYPSLHVGSSTQLCYVSIFSQRSTRQVARGYRRTRWQNRKYCSTSLCPSFPASRVHQGLLTLLLNSIVLPSSSSGRTHLQLDESHEQALQSSRTLEIDTQDRQTHEHELCTRLSYDG